jgi:DHA1 family bicyclomycin/chloramphenicol resistance-like MFS transporter
MSHFLRLAVALGLITAVGPFAIDMYLPARPSIGANLGAGADAVQATLMAYFIVIGVCQLVYGPLADMVGRKLPLYGGLTLFVVGSIGCALSPDVQTLIAFRVVQALGACAGMVIPRAVVRDLHTGHEATKLMSMLMLVMSVSPILAPTIGSFVIAAFGWRGVFWSLTLAAAVAFFLVAFVLEETRPPEARRGSSWGGAFRSYGRLLKDRRFIGLTMVSGFGISSFFAYLGSASFVLQDHYGLTPNQFALCFSLNAASFFGFSQLTGRMTKRFGLPTVIRPVAGDDGRALHRLRLLGPGAADRLGSGARESRPDRRHRLRALRRALDDRRRRHHGTGRPVLRRHRAAHGRHDRGQRHPRLGHRLRRAPPTPAGRGRRSGLVPHLCLNLR